MRILNCQIFIFRDALSTGGPAINCRRAFRNSAVRSKVLGVQMARLWAFASAIEIAFALATIPATGVHSKLNFRNKMKRDKIIFMSLIRAFNWFTKITAWPIYNLLSRPKYYYEDKKIQNRKIKGGAIIVSNHMALFDYPVFMFTFFCRTLRYQMAEVLFEKKVLGWLLKRLGAIYVDRRTFDFSFIKVSEDILKNGGVVGIFPESRLPRPQEERPLPFKPSFAYVAFSSGAPLIPCFTNGSYFSKKRTRVIIGKPLYPQDYFDKTKTKKENMAELSKVVREKIIELGKLLDEQCKK